MPFGHDLPFKLAWRIYGKPNGDFGETFMLLTISLYDCSKFQF